MIIKKQCFHCGSYFKRIQEHLPYFKKFLLFNSQNYYNEINSPQGLIRKENSLYSFDVSAIIKKK